MLFKLTKFAYSFAKDVAKEWYSQQILGNPPTPYVPGPEPVTAPAPLDFAERMNRAMEKDAPVVKFKTTTDAIAETNSQMSQVRSETRNRNKWVYKVTDDPVEDVKAFFNLPDAIAVVGAAIGGAHDGERVVALWRGQGEPDSEPNF